MYICTIFNMRIKILHIIAPNISRYTVFKWQPYRCYSMFHTLIPVYHNSLKTMITSYWGWTICVLMSQWERRSRHYFLLRLQFVYWCHNGMVDPGITSNRQCILPEIYNMLEFLRLPFCSITGRKNSKTYEPLSRIKWNVLYYRILY